MKCNLSLRMERVGWDTGCQKEGVKGGAERTGTALGERLSVWLPQLWEGCWPPFPPNLHPFGPSEPRKDKDTFAQLTNILNKLVLCRSPNKAVTHTIAQPPHGAA